jgi:hypothetical protein
VVTISASTHHNRQQHSYEVVAFLRLSALYPTQNTYQQEKEAKSVPLVLLVLPPVVLKHKETIQCLKRQPIDNYAGERALAVGKRQ